MRKSLLVVTGLLLIAVPSFARDRHQSYISYDEGQAVVRQDDGREVEARVNVPIFPGDELETGRRGRSEVRLADGNVMAVDRNTAVRFQSILDSFEGDSEQTVTELLFGTAIVHMLRTDSSVRIDTSNATYVSRSRSLYSVESGRGTDELAVFTGSVEVRTPDGSERVRAGERVRVDERGIYGLNSTASYGDTDFERWYMRRAERYGRTGRYLDSRIAWAEEDLYGYGRWVYVNDYNNWVWRPHVSVGWRPYHHGRWRHNRWGSLVWISDEPWGWVPYHYGRWAFSPVYGWVWVPGAAYSHAWVYWAFGPSYIGWIPAGFYDCYGPYYRWAYHPRVSWGVDFGFGFFGRVRLANIDYRAWTFVDPSTLVSNRIDRAALTVDTVRDRLTRDGDRAAVSAVFPRIRPEELRDPASAIGGIVRRGIGSGTGRDSSGSTVDMTPFFRRDPELPASVRERIARPIAERTPGGGSAAASSGSAGSGAIRREPAASPSGGGVISRRGGGVVSDTGSDRSGPVARRGGGVVSDTGTGDRSGVISRRPDAGTSTDRGTDSGRVIGRRPGEGALRGDGEDAPSSVVPRGRDVTPRSEPRDDSWRGRVNRRDPDAAVAPRGDDAPAPRSDWRSRGGAGMDTAGERVPRTPDRVDSDIPRRVIDRIGGARVEPSDRPRSRGEGMSRPDSGSREVSRPSSGASPGRIERPSSSPPPAARAPEPSASSGSGSIKRRDNE